MQVTTVSTLLSIKPEGAPAANRRTAHKGQIQRPLHPQNRFWREHRLLIPPQGYELVGLAYSSMGGHRIPSRARAHGL
jgi:hypothetical protein